MPAERPDSLIGRRHASSRLYRLKVFFLWSLDNSLAGKPSSTSVALSRSHRFIVSCLCRLAPVTPEPSRDYLTSYAEREAPRAPAEASGAVLVASKSYHIHGT